MKKADKIVFSLIIPTHNSSAYLSKLLATIPHRHDLEVIVVDDHSDKEELTKTKQALQKANFTHGRLIQNLGTKSAGAARNVGIENSKGAWIIFADSDDTLDPEQLELALEKYKDSSADLVYFKYNSTSRDKSIIKLYDDFSTTPTRKHAVSIRYGIPAVWSKFIKKQLIEINNLRSDETIVWNDWMLSTQLAYHSKELVIDPSISYYILTHRLGSLVSTQTLERHLVRESVAIRRNQFLATHLSKRDYRLTAKSRFLLVMTALNHFGIKQAIRSNQRLRQAGIPSRLTQNLKLLLNYLKRA